MTIQKPRIILTQKLTQDYVLVIYINNTTKLAEIPLGTIEKDARAKADSLIAAMRETDGYIDQTK